MNELQNSLGPLSQLVFANRNMVIMVLGAAVLLITCYALIANWRVERLRRDLAETKTMVNKTPGRYTPRAQVVAEPADQTELPPIKGGRSYARNLGSALQKAGIPAQPIYSPPVPGGWAPVPQTPAGTQPAPQPSFQPPSMPWGAPAAPPATPWQFPGGPARPVAPGQPTGQPQAPGFPAPGLYAPPGASPQGPVIQSAPPFQIPGFTPPPPVPPPGAFAPPSQGEGGDEAGSNQGRGGKKRKRFNFVVREGLEKLEKMVQSKRADTAAAPTDTPVAEPQVAPIAPAPITSAASPTMVRPAPMPVQATPVVEPEPVEEAAPAPPVAETLPLQFEAEEATEGPESLEAPQAVEATEAEAAVAEPEAEAVTAEPEPEREPEPEPEPVVAQSPRQSMRSMLFGEEPETVTAKSKAATERETETEPQAQPVAMDEVQEEAVAETPTETVPPAEEPAYGSATSESYWPTERDGATESAPAETVPPAEELGFRGDSAGTVVIIEDDQAVAQYYAALFKGNGFRVEVANDGVSGVDLCAKVQPDVILLDVMMPRQNGILVLQTLRASEETRNTPVVVLSNFTEPTLIKRALQLGALEYVIKTQVEGPALLEAMPRWMRREKAFAAAA